LIAVSTASAPVFIGSAFSYPVTSQSSRTNGPIWSLWNARDVKVSFDICSSAAAMMAE